MKFKVRDGFVVKIVNVIDLGDGHTQAQETTTYGGQVVDLTPDQADDHAHKIEGLGKDSTAYLDAKVMPVSSTDSLGITPQMAALAEAIAASMVDKIMARQADAKAAA